MSVNKLFYEKEPEYRKTVIGQLVNYLKDSGMFSILLLGKRGTGKTHWLEKIVEHDDSDCLEKIITINAWITKDSDEIFWQKQFEKADNGLLVIDDIEELSKQSQAILFEFLSTKNGKYGWDKKEIQCRVVFTSTLNVKTLRDSEQYLLHKFFDRISQFVVQFPSFDDNNKNIWNDFKATWEKMQFSTDKMPNDKFRTWLNENSHKFHGNFRDLDKLAINWHNYQQSDLEIDKVFEKVTKYFFELYHFPEKKSENDNVFYINQDLDYYKEIQPNFKNFVKSYAKKLYGTNLSKAPNGKPFGVPWRTMDRW
jgi:DNA-binding NtrC family response regulator